MNNLSLIFDNYFQNTICYQSQKFLLTNPTIQQLIYSVYTDIKIDNVQLHCYGDLDNANLIILYFNGSAFLPTCPKREIVNYMNLVKSIKTKTAVVSMSTGELKYPDTMNDYLKAYEYLKSKNKHIIFMGTSSGGLFSMSCIIKLIEQKAILPLGLVLISPYVNCEHKIPSNKYDFQRKSKEFYSTKLMKNIKKYCGCNDLSSPLISPSYYDFKKWIPTLLFHAVGDVIVEPHIHDVINKIKNKGNTKIILQNNVIHAWLCVTWYKTENHKGLKQISTWIEKLRK